MRLGLLVALALGCGGSVDDEVFGECERSAYESERTRYRCSSGGALEMLDCGEWVTIERCDSPSACSPGPDPGCG